MEPWIVCKRCSILYFITGWPFCVLLNIFSRAAFLWCSTLSLSSFLAWMIASLSTLAFSSASRCFSYNSFKLCEPFFFFLFLLFWLTSSPSFSFYKSKRWLTRLRFLVLQNRMHQRSFLMLWYTNGANNKEWDLSRSCSCGRIILLALLLQGFLILAHILGILIELLLLL